MTGLTNFASKTALDALFPTSAATNYIAYSTNGTTEGASVMVRTSIGATGWSAATNADPSVKANANALTSAAAGSGGTITHFSVYDASSAGNQMTDWTALGASRTVATGDQLTWAVAALQITVT